MLNNISDFGAVADGITVCTKEIQRAIDLCEKGGTVVIPAGVFVSVALVLLWAARWPVGWKM